MLTARCIWQQAEHNAFTDLIWFRQALWCVFREGSAHVSADGAFRLLRSADLGQSWHSAALISASDADLRDAKLSVQADGSLLILGAGALHNRERQSHQSYIWQSHRNLRGQALNFDFWNLRGQALNFDFCEPTVEPTGSGLEF